MVFFMKENLSSGIGHSLLVAKAECAGRDYVCLRGENFLHGTKSGPWLYAPTVAFVSEPPGGVSKNGLAVKKVFDSLAQDWPVFTQARLVCADQAMTGKWGGATGNGRIKTVTRLAFDFGKVNKLPKILFKPGQKLDAPRDPVFWALAEHVSIFDRPIMQRAIRSAYALAGDYAVDMEVDKEGGAIGVVVRDMSIQHNVGDMFVKAFGRGFFTPRPFRHEKQAQLLLATSFP